MQCLHDMMVNCHSHCLVCRVAMSNNMLLPLVGLVTCTAYQRLGISGIATVSGAWGENNDGAPSTSETRGKDRQLSFVSSFPSLNFHETQTS